MIENRGISASVLAGSLRIADILVVPLAGMLAYYTRFNEIGLGRNEALVLVLVSILAANVFHFLRLYDFKSLTADPLQLKRLFFGLVIVVFVTLSIGYVTKTSDEFSRIWMSTWAIYTAVLLVTVRGYFKVRLARLQANGWLTRRIALVGAGPQGQRVANYLSDKAHPGFTIVGIFDDRRSRVPTRIAGQPVRGGVSALLDFIRRERVDEVIVALPWSAEDRLLEIMKRLRTAPVDVRLCPEGVAFQFSSRSFSDLYGVSLLNIYERPLSSWGRVIKNAEDRILASLILLFILPLLIGIAIAIKLDSRGPILFRQRRYGFNNELIEILKFRTLHHTMSDWNDERQVTRNDSRVTRVGAFLRRTSMDELPQFINVLRGEMSIVGPRPHALMSKAGGRIFEEVVAEYFARHRVKPGITGWAQIHGLRGETETAEKLERRIEYDLDYIERWSLWLDLKIILLTPFAMIVSKADG